MSNKHEQLEQKIEDLVWMAWQLGMQAGNPMTPPAKEDKLHLEVWMELKAVRELVNTLSMEK